MRGSLQRRRIARSSSAPALHEGARKLQGVCMHPEPDFESNPSRRAYESLLGDNYEETLFAHVELSSVAKPFARDLETAMEWNRGGINEWLIAWRPPGPY